GSGAYALDRMPGWSTHAPLTRQRHVRHWSTSRASAVEPFFPPRSNKFRANLLKLLDFLTNIHPETRYLNGRSGQAECAFSLMQIGNTERREFDHPRGAGYHTARRASTSCPTTPSVICFASPPSARATGRRSAASSTARRRAFR